MPYHQSLEYCLHETIGRYGVPREVLASCQKGMAQAVQDIQDEGLRLFDFSDSEEKVAEIEAKVTRWQADYDTLYVLGTGGSTLCPQTICGLAAAQRSQKKVVFVDNVDPGTVHTLVRHTDLDRSLFLVTSKSGRTIELLTQFLVFVNAMIARSGRESLSQHFVVLTEVQNSHTPLMRMARTLGLEVLPHENVGGRFSIFSNVGLLAARFVDLDIAAFLRGAEETLQETYAKGAASAPAVGAALNAAFAETGHIASTVMMPYIDDLRNFTSWFSQIWAESLGKTAQATTPIRALGTLDQHSQLQMFLEGRHDKLYNIISAERCPQGEALEGMDDIIPDEIGFLRGKRVSDVMEASMQSTLHTLTQHGLPVRHFRLKKVDEATLGALSMHFILEVVLLAKRWDINPFDQPAVEEGKVKAISILSAKESDKAPLDWAFLPAKDDQALA